jgi:hypothetical protein
MDPWFRSLKDRMEIHPTFVERDGFIWTKNQGEEDVVCILKAESGDTMLYTRILKQAHQVVGHYGPQRTADYI